MKLKHIKDYKRFENGLLEEEDIWYTNCYMCDEELAVPYNNFSVFCHFCNTENEHPADYYFMTDEIWGD